MSSGSAKTSGKLGRMSVASVILRLVNSASNWSMTGLTINAGEIGTRVKRKLALLDPMELEKVLNHPVKAIRALAGGFDQFTLLFVKWTDGFLGQQVNRKAGSSKRSLELMRDRGNQTALEFVG